MDCNKPVSVKILRNSSYEITDIGVYKFWCKKKEFIQLLDRLDSHPHENEKTSITFEKVKDYTETCTLEDTKEKLYCIYVGKAQGQSLSSRVVNIHIKGTPNGSTLRESLFGILNDFEGNWDSTNQEHRLFNEVQVNNFLDELYVQFIPCKNEEETADKEKEEINNGKYIRILNGKGFLNDKDFENEGGNPSLRKDINIARRHFRNKKLKN
ncbi:MAG: GIY-YIG nuclease family protein [Bacilli bacterium]|jgi:hypothetical protein